MRAPFVHLDANAVVPVDEMTDDHIRRRIAYAAHTEPLDDTLADELSYWAQRLYNRPVGDD